MTYAGLIELSIKLSSSRRRLVYYESLDLLVKRPTISVFPPFPASATASRPNPSHPKSTLPKSLFSDEAFLSYFACR